MTGQGGRRSWIRSLLALVAAALLPSCTGATGPIDSDLPKDKLVSDLSADELLTFCEAIASGISEAYEGVDLCQSTAYLRAGNEVFASEDDFTDEALQDVCAAEYRACMDDPERNGGQVVILPCTSTPTTADTCHVTVAEWEQCVNEYTRQTLTFLNVPSDCASITRAGVEAFADSDAAGAGSGQPASCDLANAACPHGF